MNKSKYATLISGQEERINWRIGLSVLTSGEIRRRGTIEIEDIDGSLTIKVRKTKHFTLISGRENQFNWSIGLLVGNDGKIKWSSGIEIVNSTYFKIDKRKHLKAWRDWYCRHRKELLKEKKLEREANPEHFREMGKQRYHKNPTPTKRANARRKRELGFVPLNEPFSDADAHHIDETYVVYMPSSIHRSFYHNLKKPDKNLDILNSVAYAEIYIQELR